MMRAKRTILICSLALGFARIAKAENEASGYWAGIFPVHQVTESETLSLQAEFRRLGPTSLGLYRPSYHRKLSSSLSLGVGYDYFQKREAEQRLWPELTGAFVLRDSLGMVDWRLREEFRFKQGRSETGTRTRLLLAWHRDFSSRKAVTLFFFDEFFWQQNSFKGWSSRAERNWLGTRLRFGPPKLHIDIGGFWESVMNSKKTGLVATLSLGTLF